jgi:hypothetical protein
MTESETRSTLPADYERQLRDAHLQPLSLADVSAAIRAEPGPPIKETA